MQTKIEITMTATEAAFHAPGFDKDGAASDAGPLLAERITEHLGLASETGGWYWKITRPEGNVKMVGKLVPAGGSVVG